ncbi:MAG: glycosyltransferase family 39 protein [Solirubrobacteraceae bacterium]
MNVDTLRGPTRPLSSPEGVAHPSRVRALLDEGHPWLSRWGPLGLMLVLTLVSLLLRSGHLRLHYWVDEGLSVGIASHHLGQIPGVLRQDGSPPLYYVLLHFWMGLRGRGEVATHELSLIFAVASVPAAYWAGRSLFDRRTGVVCSLMVAALPYLSVYAQETRMYSLVVLLTLVACASFVHAFVFARRRYLPAFIVSLTAALYTHNWALFLALMAAVAFLFCVYATPAERRRALWRDGVIAFCAIAVLYAPWIPTVLYQAAHTGAPWAAAPVLWSFTQGAYFLVGGRGAAVALLFGAGAGLLALFGAQMGLLATSGGGAQDSADVGSDGGGARGGDDGGSDRGEDRDRNRLAAQSLLVLGLGTLIVAWLYAKSTSTWALRYLAVIVGPLTLVVGLGLTRARRLGLVALVLVACFWVLDPTPGALDAKSNVASAAAKVRREVGSDALVLSTQPEQVATLAYYLPRVSHFGTPLGPVPDPRVFDWRGALPRLRRSSVRSVLEPMLRSLTTGERVVLAVPTRLPQHPLWLKLIDRYSMSWTRYLSHDHALEQVASVSPHAGSSGLPVRVTVFVRR